MRAPCRSEIRERGTRTRSSDRAAAAQRSNDLSCGWTLPAALHDRQKETSPARSETAAHPRAIIAPRQMPAAGPRQSVTPITSLTQDDDPSKDMMQRDRLRLTSRPAHFLRRL